MNWQRQNPLCASAVQYRRTLHFWQNFFSALSAPLRAEVPPDRVLVAARRARPGNLALGTRFFEQEKTERTEHDWNLSISPLPLLPPVRILCLVAALHCYLIKLFIFDKIFAAKEHKDKNLDCLFFCDLLRSFVANSSLVAACRAAALRLCVEVFAL